MNQEVKNKEFEMSIKALNDKFESLTELIQDGFVKTSKKLDELVDERSTVRQDLSALRNLYGNTSAIVSTNTNHIEKIMSRIDRVEKYIDRILLLSGVASAILTPLVIEFLKRMFNL